MNALSPSPIPIAEPDAIPEAGPIHRVFESQRATALRWRESTAEERIARIRKLRDAVQAAADDIRRAAAADFRKPEVEVDLTELFTVISEANMAMRKLRRWMKPTRVGFTPLMAGTQGRIEYQPRGRCLIISPWNYPVNLTFCPLVLALAASLEAESALVLAALAEAARVARPEGRIAIVDFAAHQREELRDRHAHARLGFEDGQMASLLDEAGFEPAAPMALEDGELVVKIWIAQRRAANRKAAS